MFKRREIYRHLSNAADRMAHSANTLHDIVVKMCERRAGRTIYLHRLSTVSRGRFTSVGFLR